MDSAVCSADGRDGGSAGDDELVVLALVVGHLGLGKDHVVKVKSEEKEEAINNSLEKSYI